MVTNTAPQQVTGAHQSISEVATTTGLTQDTLRWYERQGMFAPIARGTDRRRAYSSADVARIMLLVKLRRTGMSIADMQRFAHLLEGGVETHPERMALLRGHRSIVLAQLAQIHSDLEAVDSKIAHYEELIANGRDCEAAPSELNRLDNGVKK